MKTIILLSGVEYSSTKQRPHHMARYFAKKGFNVIYLGLHEEYEVINKDKFKKLSYKELLDRYTFKTDEGIIILKRIVTSEKKINEGLAELLAKLERYFISSDVAFIVGFPEWVKYLEKISNECKVIYDCMDDWASFVMDLEWGYTQKLIQYERKLASLADLVVASARSLHLKMVNLNENVIYLPNGVWNEDYSICSDSQVTPNDIVNINKPIVLFMGAIAGWVDIELIKYLAERRSNYSFVFLGNLVKEELPEMTNIIFLGHKRYEELPLYLSKAKVAIIPFKVNKLTAAVTPLKFYEYLSSSTPVVTTIMPDLIGLKGSKVALDYADFLNHVDNYIIMGKREYELEKIKSKSTGMNFDWNILLKPLCSFIYGENIEILSKNEFAKKTIELYENYIQNEFIQNELVALYNLQGQFETSCSLIKFEEVIEGTHQIDYINLALAYIKVGNFQKAITLLRLGLNNNLLTIYLESLMKENCKQFLLEIYLYKLSGDIYQALELLDNSLTIDIMNPKLLGILCGLYLDLGEYDIAFQYAVEALSDRDDLGVEEVFDDASITFLVEYLSQKGNYEFAEEIALSLMKLNIEWDEKAVELLSNIYLSKYLGD